MPQKRRGNVLKYLQIGCKKWQNTLAYKNTQARKMHCSQIHFVACNADTSSISWDTIQAMYIQTSHFYIDLQTPVSDWIYTRSYSVFHPNLGLSWKPLFSCIQKRNVGTVIPLNPHRKFKLVPCDYKILPRFFIAQSQLQKKPIGEYNLCPLPTIIYYFPVCLTLPHLQCMSLSDSLWKQLKNNFASFSLAPQDYMFIKERNKLQCLQKWQNHDTQRCTWIWPNSRTSLRVHNSNYPLKFKTRSFIFWQKTKPLFGGITIGQTCQFQTELMGKLYKRNTKAIQLVWSVAPGRKLLVCTPGYWGS